MDTSLNSQASQPPWYSTIVTNSPIRRSKSCSDLERRRLPISVI